MVLSGQTSCRALRLLAHGEIPAPNDAARTQAMHQGGLRRLESVKVGVWICAELARDLVDAVTSFCRSQTRDVSLGSDSAQLTSPQPKGAQNQEVFVGGEIPIEHVPAF